MIHELYENIQWLLEKANLSTVIESIKNISNGGNNRTYKLETSDGIFAVKKYFRQYTDHRDRLAAEYKFLSYAKKVAAAYVPMPYSKNEAEGMALYEFIAGSPITHVSEYEVTEACQFFQALNKQKQDGMHLPRAAEACFSLHDHLNLVQRRIDVLRTINLKCEENYIARCFIEKLCKQWECLVNKVNDLSIVYGMDKEHVLENINRCISPSDFGFHNALKMPDGCIKFIDFEYAGWDDPAKLIADFFSQLAVPVPKKFFHAFSVKTLNQFDQADILFARAKILYPVYQIKWCCIALNVFIPEHLARRQFANPGLDVAVIKKQQLLKAETILSKLTLFT